MIFNELTLFIYICFLINIYNINKKNTGLGFKFAIKSKKNLQYLAIYKKIA